MAVQDSKMVLLYIAKILQEESDEEHVFSSADLIRRLHDQWDIDVTRRTVYNDIDALAEAGMDIVTVSGDRHGYYVGSRTFDLAELKMLVDIIQVSCGLSEKKSGQLIRKIEGLASTGQAKQLQQQVVLSSRPKAKNENVFYHIDTITSAIEKNRKISFQYADWTMEKSYQLRHDGAGYVVSPCALVWDDEKYYLVAWADGTKEERHYRVDKMRNVVCLEDERADNIPFDPAAFEKKTFGMYSGHDADVTLECPDRLVGVILDRFGSDVMLIPAENDGTEEKKFHVRVPVTVSRQFFGWVTAIGPEIRIVGPDQVRQEYRQYLQKILEGA